jgi:hypothetical protein
VRTAFLTADLADELHLVVAPFFVGEARTPPHPHTRRGYLLGSYVRCGLCDQRMFGKIRHGDTYYNCYRPTTTPTASTAIRPTTPKAVYLREDARAAA